MSALAHGRKPCVLELCCFMRCGRLSLFTVKQIWIVKLLSASKQQHGINVVVSVGWVSGASCRCPGPCARCPMLSRRCQRLRWLVHPMWASPAWSGCCQVECLRWARLWGGAYVRNVRSWQAWALCIPSWSQCARMKGPPEAYISSCFGPAYGCAGGLISSVQPSCTKSLTLTCAVGVQLPLHDA